MKWITATFPELHIHGVAKFEDGVFRSTDPQVLARMAPWVGRYGITQVAEDTDPPDLPLRDPWPGAVLDIELFGSDGKVRESVLPPRLSDVELRAALDARIAEQPTVVAAAAAAVDSAVQSGNVVPRFPDVGLIPPQVIAKDTFTRADNPSSMGTAETGQAWILTATGGAEAGIIGNAAYLRVSGSGLRHSLLDCGARDVMVTLDGAIIPAASSIGFSLRSLDASNAMVLSFSEGTQQLTVSSVNDGSATIRATVPITLPAGTHRLAARIEGDENATFIQSYVDDVLVHTLALNSADRVKFANGTRHGIRWATSSTTVRAEAITITTLALPTSKQLREWAAAEAYEVLTAAVLDTDGFVPSATVRWPDGAPGIYTLVTKKIDTAYKAVDAYTLTHISAGRKVTQTVPTRATTGNVTSKPALTVGAI